MCHNEQMFLSPKIRKEINPFPRTPFHKKYTRRDGITHYDIIVPMYRLLGGFYTSHLFGDTCVSMVGKKTDSCDLFHLKKVCMRILC